MMFAGILLVCPCHRVYKRFLRCSIDPNIHSKLDRLFLNLMNSYHSLFLFFLFLLILKILSTVKYEFVLRTIAGNGMFRMSVIDFDNDIHLLVFLYSIKLN